MLFPGQGTYAQKRWTSVRWCCRQQRPNVRREPPAATCRWKQWWVGETSHRRVYSITNYYGDMYICMYMYVYIYISWKYIYISIHQLEWDMLGSDGMFIRICIYIHTISPTTWYLGLPRNGNDKEMSNPPKNHFDGVHFRYLIGEVI